MDLLRSAPAYWRGMARRPGALIPVALALPLMLTGTMMWTGCVGAKTAKDSSKPPIAVSVQASQDVGVGVEQELWVEVALDAAAENDVERPIVNLAMVLDTSGSMEGDALVQAKHAASTMLNQLRDGDRVAIIAFDSEVRTILPSTEIDADVRETVGRALAELRAYGTTDLGGGLSAGVDQVLSHHSPRGINRVVLLGDGVPNDEMPVRNALAQATNRGISITALGLGDTYDEVLMGEIAQQSGGRFHDVDSPDQVARLFKDEVLRLESVQIKQARLELTPGPDVHIEGIAGYDAQAQGRGVVLPIGDMSRGDEKHIFVRVRVSARAHTMPVELLDAFVSYQTTDGKPSRVGAFVGVHAVAPKAAEASRNEALVDEAEVREASACIIEALELAKTGQRSAAIELLRAGEIRAKARAERREHKELQDLAERMRGLASDLPIEQVDAQNQAAPPPPAAPAKHSMADQQFEAAPIAAAEAAGSLNESGFGRSETRGLGESGRPAPMPVAPLKAPAPGSARRLRETNELARDLLMH